MARLAALTLSVVVLGGALVGCRHGLFGGPSVKRVRLKVARTGDDVVFTASDDFDAIVCSLYDAARAPSNAASVVPGNEPRGARAVRIVWRAHCPSGSECGRAVTYGDAALRTDLGPAPLGPSQPGDCYLCGVSGERRRGDVLFSIDADGQIVDCPHSDRRRE